MGIDIGFSYDVEDKSRFHSQEVGSDCLHDLFEAPDVFKSLGILGGTTEGLKKGGFLPSFVENYRSIMGSSNQALSDEETQTEQSFEEFMAMMDSEEWENPTVDFAFDAQEAEEWALLWLDLFESKNFQNPEVIKLVLPYNHDSLPWVKEALQNLKAQAREAKESNVQLRIEAILG